MGLTICPSKWIYHLPCPGCGVTRATLLWFNGRVFEAMRLNPNSLLAVLFVLLYPIAVVLSIIRRRSYIVIIYNRVNRILACKKVFLMIAVAELVVWVHNIIVGL